MTIYNLITEWRQEGIPWTEVQSFKDFETAYQAFLDQIHKDEDEGIDCQIHSTYAPDDVVIEDFCGYTDIVLGKHIGTKDGSIYIKTRIEMTTLQ